MSIWESALTLLSGSQPSDISDDGARENPLPPCPNSANCIRTTQLFNTSIGSLFDTSVETLNQMGPEKMSTNKKCYAIEAVFKVVVFRDDMNIKLSKRDSSSVIIHIRSASRVGKADLGVNRRRVKRFLNKLSLHL